MNWYVSKTLPEIISDYKSKQAPFSKSKSFKHPLHRLARQLETLSLCRTDCGLDLREIFYAYVYLDPRYPAEYAGQYRYVLPSGKVVTFSHRPLYAGKGYGRRMFHHLGVAKRSTGKQVTLKVGTLRKLDRLGLKPPIISTGTLVNEAMAFAYEIDLIAGIGRYDLGLGPLTNLSDGGEGNSGKVTSQKTRNKISAAKLGKPQSKEHKAAGSVSRMGRVVKESTKEKIRVALSNRVFSVDSLRKMSASKKGRPLSEAHRAALRKPKSHIPTRTCPHCGTTGDYGNTAKYHFDKCKENPNRLD